MKNTSYPACASAPTTAGPVVGIDVSKHHLDIATWPAMPLKVVRVANDNDGHERLIKTLASLSPRRVVLEATGGYQRVVAAALQRAGFTVAVVNPRPVRDLAKGHGILAKTDRLDAGVIARYGHDVKVRDLEPIDESRENRADLIARRHQLVEGRAAELCRIQQTRNVTVIASLKKHIAFLDEQIEDLDKQIRQSIEANPQAKALADELENVKGVGRGTSNILVSRLPELGRVGRQTAASLVGIAPFNDDSGSHRGLRRIRGGRADVRAVLYMATVTAARCNAVIKPHYQQLRARGKSYKVAIIACMRKLLTHLNNLARAVIESTAAVNVPT